jgi:hypothetical protein
MIKHTLVWVGVIAFCLITWAGIIIFGLMFIGAE